MCNFISWLEIGDWVFFLKNSDLETYEGKKLVKYLKETDGFTGYISDIQGHGAIKKYFNYRQWDLPKRIMYRECKDFSKPKNFPNEIVQALKKGELSKIACGNFSMFSMFTQTAQNKLIKQIDSIWEKINTEIQEKAQFNCPNLSNDEDKIIYNTYSEQMKLFWDFFSNPKNRTKVWR